MLGPGFLGLEVERLAGRGFGLLEAVHLFVTEGQHAIKMRTIPVGRLGLLGDRQHRRRIAAVEAEILVQLDRGEVAREFFHDPFADTLDGRDVVGDPALQLVAQHSFSGIGHRTEGLRAPKIDRGMIRGARRFEEHPAEAGIDIGQYAVRFAVGRDKDVSRLLLIAQKAGDEIVDPRQRRGGGGAHFISQRVLCHGRKRWPLSKRSN